MGFSAVSICFLFFSFFNCSLGLKTKSQKSDSRSLFGIESRCGTSNHGQHHPSALIEKPSPQRNDISTTLPPPTMEPLILILLLLSVSFITPVANTTTLNLPSCALPCYTTALSNTTCSATDFYCQCTSPNAAIIQDRAIPCLCHSDCSTTQLLQVVQDSDQVCSSAVAAKGGTYTASSIGLGVCATATTTASTGTGTVVGVASSSSVGIAGGGVGAGGVAAAAAGVVFGWVAVIL